MDDPLLSYSLTTVPLPLQVNGSNGSIVIAASNPGYFSDKPDNNYVAPTLLVFNFGDALTSNPSTIAASATYTPKNGTPVPWGSPQRTGSQFTFNPPADARIFPGDSLVFEFNGIAVGGAIASVGLDVMETASAPGDPAYPGGYYPSQPSQVRTTSRRIGIFPTSFAIDTLMASPTAAGPGMPVQLSWKASAIPNTSFSLVYVANGAVLTVSRHADGTPLGSIDTYPNSSHDPGRAISMSRTTTFSLQATYVDAGTVITGEKQVTVSVPDPTINTFTATPSTALRVGDAVHLAWQTLAADYVTIDPPLDGVNTTVPNSGGATIYPLQYARYTLTASGRGLNVRQSLILFPMSAGWTTVIAGGFWKAGLAPLTLAVNGLLWVLPGNPNSGSNPVYSSPDGRNWILVKPDAGFPLRKNAAALSDPANGKAWVMGGIGRGGTALNDVWSTTNGREWTLETAGAAWSARSDFACVWFANQYWVMGGVDATGKALNDVWTSPDGKTWTQAAVSPGWSPRSAFGLTALDGAKMWLFGGNTSGGADGGLWVSSDGLHWTPGSNPFGSNPPSPRTHCQLFATANGLFAIGGVDGGGRGLGDAYLVSPEGNWTSIDAPPFPPGSKYFGATVYQGGFWLTGGASDNALSGGVWLFVPAQ